VHLLARRLPGAPPERPRSWAPLAASCGFVAALRHRHRGLYGSRDGRPALLEWRGSPAGAVLLGPYARGGRPADGHHRDGRVQFAAPYAAGHGPGPVLPLPIRWTWTGRR
jgi:hypothetical protein